MSKLTSFIVISILFFSCQNQERLTYIRMYSHKEAVQRLTGFHKTLRLDSVRFVRSDENDWKLIDYLATSERMKLGESEFPTTFSVLDFYSDTLNKHYKIVYSSSVDGVLKIVSDEDRFYRKLNDTIEIYLNRNYNHLNKEISYSADSLPTPLFIEKNRQKLKEMSVHARQKHIELCGTAAHEILRRGFPERSTEISEARFQQLQSN